MLSDGGGEGGEERDTASGLRQDCLMTAEGEGNVLDRWPALGAGTRDAKAKERDKNCVTPTNMGNKETVKSLSFLVKNFQH